MEHFARKLLNTTGFLLALLLQIFASIFLTCLIGPIFLTSWLVNELLRLLVSGVLYLKFGSKIHLVTLGSDNIWHYEKDGNNRVCFVMAFCNDLINVEAYRELFNTRVINHKTPQGLQPYKKLRKTFTKMFGYHCFRDDGSFDIKDHIRVYSGGDNFRDDLGVVTESELMEKILPELSQDMDDSKPQWEDVIVPRVRLDDEDKITCARIFRYHHGYMDGVSALLMWSHCMTSQTPPGKQFPYPVDPLKPLRISKITKLFMNFLCCLLGAWTMVKGLYTGSTVKNRYVTPKFSGKRHFAWSQKIEVSHLKKIKSATKVSVPTILSAATGTALLKTDRRHPSRDPQFEGSKADEVTVGMVSAILPYPDISPRNHFTITHFSIATGEMPWYQRVQLVNKEMQKLKWDPAVYINAFMFAFFGRFPAAIVQNVMGNGGVPISYSNVPMTNKPINLWGNEVRECAGWAPLLTNTGLAIVSLRYADHMRFCCMADEACLSKEELEFFISAVVTEIGVMAEECSNPLSNLDPFIISIDPLYDNAQKNCVIQC